MKVEIKNYRPTNKGGFIAFFTVCIEGLQAKINGEWNSLTLELTDCKYFKKGDSRWFKYADKEYKTKQGEQAFAPMVRFNLPQDMVLEALKLREGNAQVPTNPRQENSIQAEPSFDFTRPPF